MADIEIKRGYEVLPDNNVRFGIRVINSSDAAISEVEVILDFNESLFELEGNKLQTLGTIPPAVPRTAKFILKPRGCIHKAEIAATVRYKDPQWNRHSVEMRPKEVHCVCPFLKEKPITRAEFLTLAASGYTEERGINFEAIEATKGVDFLLHTCHNRLFLVDDVSIENGRILYLAGDAVGEKAYYLLTAVVKEYEGVIQVLLRATSDKRHGLTGFLNELIENLRHLVSSVARAREIGVIKKEQVINIIDSVVQRTTFAAGEGAPSVTIRDSVVQRTEIKDTQDEKRRREEIERLRCEQEERELRAREDQEARERRAREEAEKKRREREERLKQEQEKQERHRKAEEEMKRKEGVLFQEPKKSSRTKIFAVIIVFSALLLGYWGFTSLSHDGTQLGSPVVIPSLTHTPTPENTLKAPSTAFVVEGVVSGFDTTPVTIIHHGGDNVLDAFNTNAATTTDFWHNMEVRYNGAKVSQTITLNDDTLTEIPDDKTDFIAGDELGIQFGMLSPDDSITIVYTPTGAVMQRIKVR